MLTYRLKIQRSTQLSIILWVCEILRIFNDSYSFKHHFQLLNENVCSQQMYDLPVDKFAADAALEEPAAPIARQDPVMLSTRRVPANEAGQTWRTSLQEGRGGGGGLHAANGVTPGPAEHGSTADCRRCRHGRLVQDHAVDHSSRENRGRRSLGVRWRGAGQGGHGVVIETVMVMVRLVERWWSGATAAQVLLPQ